MDLRKIEIFAIIYGIAIETIGLIIAILSYMKGSYEPYHISLLFFVVYKNY